MVIKNVSKQVLPLMINLPDGKKGQKILRPGNEIELLPEEVTPDVEGKIKKKLFKVM